MNSGLSDTKRDILETLKRRGMMTIDEIVDCFDLSKTAVRAHLVALEDDGMLAGEKAPSEGRGRPPMAYRVTDKGAATFATDDTILLTRLLDFLGRRGAGELIEAFFDELWSERLEEVRATLNTKTLDSAPRQQRLEVLEQLLATHDFMPEIQTQTCSDGDTTITVRECNCPFPAAVRATRLPCQLETEFLAEVLGATVTRASFASKRSETCQFDFTVDGA